MRRRNWLPAVCSSKPGSTPRRAISSKTWRPRSLGTGPASRSSPPMSRANPHAPVRIVEFQGDAGLGDAGLDVAFDAGLAQRDGLLGAGNLQQRHRPDGPDGLGGLRLGNPGDSAEQ
ncbi:hypothetical protein G6F50_013760 [Rhizopus delemar]|uniref:Uncharacterized protein n=1 Tax=Rhizopus delemar TaxID=936053 RepID=A0A9P7CBV7_9FUNG|nr:hypothetical protein G6F50_013760 [Rhizopus delemar]